MPVKRKTFKIRKLVRHCVIADCAKKLNVVVNTDKTILGGHYFGRMNLGNGKKAEYWECEACYQDSKSVEDTDDLQIIEERKNEPVVSAEKVAKKLGLRIKRV